MKIAILGVGSLGTYFGGLLSLNGADVSLIIRNIAHQKAIKTKGLTLRIDGIDTLVHPKSFAPSEVKDIGFMDLIFIFTKTNSSKDALENAKSLIGKETRLISLQNGLGNEKILSNFAPLGHIIYGITTTPADLLAPALVSSSGNFSSCQFKSAEKNKKTEEMAQFLAKILNEAGIKSSINENIDKAIWTKLAFNCAINTTCALLDGTPGFVFADERLKQLILSLALEVCFVAKEALGIIIKKSTIEKMIEQSNIYHKNHKPSMVNDINNKRLSEIDSLNGTVIKIAKKHNIPTPLNEAIYALIKGLEAKY